MHENVAQEEQHERYEHWQIAPITARQNLARDHRKENQRKGEVESCGAFSTENRGNQHGHPSGHPYQGQGGQQEKRAKSSREDGRATMWSIARYRSHSMSISVYTVPRR